MVSNIFYFHPYLGKMPNLTIRIFFKWVGKKPPTSHVLDVLIHPFGSGQIRSRPHTTEKIPKKVAVWKGNPQLFQGNLGWWKTLIWPDLDRKKTSLDFIHVQKKSSGCADPSVVVSWFVLIPFFVRKKTAILVDGHFWGKNTQRQMGVSKNRGILPPKWMVYSGKPY